MAETRYRLNVHKAFEPFCHLFYATVGFIQLIENINGDTEILRYTTPEVKGRILHLLIRPDDDLFSMYNLETSIDSLAQERKKAVNTVLSWV